VSTDVSITFSLGAIDAHWGFAVDAEVQEAEWSGGTSISTTLERCTLCYTECMDLN
jgi:hypothetical protein